MDKLPLEIIIEILSYVEGHTLLMCECVNNTFKAAVDNLRYKWKKCCEKEICPQVLNSVNISIPSNCSRDWRYIYKWCYNQKLQEVDYNAFVRLMLENCSENDDKDGIIDKKIHGEKVLHFRLEDIKIYFKSVYPGNQILNWYFLKHTDALAYDKVYLTSFKTGGELNEIESILSEKYDINDLSIEILPVCCCTLAICFFTHKSYRDFIKLVKPITFVMTPVQQ